MTLTSCTPLPAPPCLKPAPSSAAAYQAAFNGLSGGWNGGDGANSLRLPDGRILWIMDDSLTGRNNPNGTRAPGIRFVRNAFVVQDAGCFTAVNGRGGGEVVPNNKTSWYWPQNGVLENGRLYLMAPRVAATGAPPGFANVGLDLAEFTLPYRANPQFVRMRSTPVSTVGNPAWGSAVTTFGGYTYIYGTGGALKVARVPIGQITTPSSWSFWDGRGWSRSPAAATDISAVGATGAGLSMDARSHGVFIAVTKPGEYRGTQLVALKSVGPVGPWRRAVLGGATTSNSRLLSYLALAHPEIKLTSGRTLVTVSRSTTDVHEFWTNPFVYRPQFREVILP